MHPPVLDGAPRGHERLCGDLAAEDALALLVRLDAPEDVDLNGLEIKQIDEELQGRAHSPMFAGRPTRPWQSTPPRPQLPCGGVTAAKQDGELEFPAGFTWGVATAAHQIEGGNVNNDWWAWEHDPASGTLEPSGDACDSFHRWREDVQLVADMGLGAYRFSLEWSRIEPAEGEFSIASLEHYRRLCAACHGHGILPVVTFHHFTTPLLARPPAAAGRRPMPRNASPASSSARRRIWAT